MSTNILVVDDDEIIRELLYLHLTNAGYNVLLAEDAIVAGYSILTTRIDLLIADIEMPFMDGLDLVRGVRGEPAVSATPVVFLTSNGDYEDAARQVGAVAFLRKPIRADEVLATVAEHASGARKLSARGAPSPLQVGQHLGASKEQNRFA